MRFGRSDLAKHYRVLGLDPNQEHSLADIQRAYKRQIMQYHPDRAPADKKVEYTQRTNDINNALSALKGKDSQSQSMPDMFGDGGFQFFTNGGGGSEGVSFGGIPLDIFSGMGGGFNGFQQQRPGSQAPAAKPKSPALKSVVEISIFECFKGCTKKVQFHRNDGYGNSITDSVTVNIPPGMKAGSRFTFENKGNSEKDKSQGDVIVTLKVRSHPTFTIDDTDVIATIPVSFKETLELRERKYSVPTVDGLTKEISIKEDEQITEKTEFTFEDLGMPIRKNFSKKRGDMIVRFKVKLPQMVNEQREEIIRTLIKY